MIKRLFSVKKNFIAKILIILITTMTITAILFDIILINIQKKTFQASYNANGTTIVHMLAHTIKLAVFTENIDEMRSSIEGVMLHDDVIEVAVFDTNNKVLSQKTKDKTGNLYIQLKESHSLADLNTLKNTAELRRETKDVIIYWHQVSISSSINAEEDWFSEENTKPEQEVIGYVAIVQSKEIFKQENRNIILQTGITVAIFLIIGILATFFIIKKVTAPLQGLLQLAHKSTKKTGSPDDLAMLSQTYESLITDLAESFTTITKLKDELEEKVLLRTKKLSKANEDLAQREEKLQISHTKLAQTLLSLQETQEQLIQQEKLASIGQLVAGVAHEINNTINFVSVALPSLKECLGELRDIIICYEEIERSHDSEKLAQKQSALRELKEKLPLTVLFRTIDQLLANIDEGITRTTGIIRDLNTYSRKDPEKTSSIDLNNLIKSTLDTVDKNRLKNIELNSDYDKLPPIQCLANRLGQVFFNIIKNGIDAMDGNGHLTIETHYKDKHAHIFFSDTGHGIAPENMHKIFDPFYTNKEVGKGTGLGLSISYSIVKRHGGEIKVQSNVGSGTTFEVILPVNRTSLEEDV